MKLVYCLWFYNDKREFLFDTGEYATFIDAMEQAQHMILHIPHAKFFTIESFYKIDDGEDDQGYED